MKCRKLDTFRKFFITFLLGFLIQLNAFADDKLCYPLQDGNTIFVNKDASGNNDGSSWTNAYITMEAALLNAASNGEYQQIWVAKGVYTVPTDQNSFTLSANIAVIGGFSGNEKQISERRDRDRHSTVLTANGKKHILYAKEAKNVLLNRLTIRGGEATGSLLNDAQDETNEVRGGGLLAYESDIVICESVFKNNTAKKFGGAIYFKEGKLSIIKSKLKKNKVLRGETEVHDDITEADTDGGAISLHDADIFISHSILKKNIAGDDGAAMAVRRANVEIISTRFEKNRAIGKVLAGGQLPTLTDDFITSTGGAITIENEATGGDTSKEIIIKGSYFSKNKSAIGSVGYILGSPGSVTLLSNNVFVQNGGDGQPDPLAPPNEKDVSFGKGAAALLIIGLRGGDREVDENSEFIRPLHQLTIKNSFFLKNQSGYGGSLVLVGLNSTITNSRFSKNSARTRAGAIWNQNFITLFDQLSGLEPAFGSTHIEGCLFDKNKVLGVLETLQVESFPGVASINEQPFGGGAISNDQGGRLSISNSSFYKNTSLDSDGGAIHNATSPVSFYGSVDAPIVYPATLNVSDSLFYGNKALGLGNGGAIANGGNGVSGAVLDADGNDLSDTVKGAKADITGSLFIANSANNNGGAIVNWYAANLAISSSHFKRNTAYENGNDVLVVNREINPSVITLQNNTPENIIEEISD